MAGKRIQFDPGAHPGSRRIGDADPQLTPIWLGAQGDSPERQDDREQPHLFTSSATAVRVSKRIESPRKNEGLSPAEAAAWAEGADASTAGGGLLAKTGGLSKMHHSIPAPASAGRREIRSQ
jgi:hypothetical protein